MTSFGCTITWAGHATFIIDTQAGKRILIDPFLTDNPACPQELKNIDRCDLILCTHAHSDHIDDVERVVTGTNATVVAILELGDWYTSRGMQNVLGINKGGTVRIGDISVTMVNAVHSSSIFLDGFPHYMGEAAGFVVTLENGVSIYHAGDTDVFGDMALIAAMYAPQIALLPIGDFFTMGPREAAMAAKLIKAKHVIPMHYGTFPVLTGTPEAFAAEMDPLLGVTVHTMRPGESLQ